MASGAFALACSPNLSVHHVCQYELCEPLNGACFGMRIRTQHFLSSTSRPKCKQGYENASSRPVGSACGSSHARALALPGPLILLAQAPRRAEIYGAESPPTLAAESPSLPPLPLPLSGAEDPGTHRCPPRTTDPGGCPHPRARAAASSMCPAEQPRTHLTHLQLQ